MSEQDLEVLITLDDPGEEDLEEDGFHNRQAENASDGPAGSDKTS